MLYYGHFRREGRGIVKHLRRLLPLLISLMILLSSPAVSFAEEIVFTPPRLSSDAEPYDPEHPEELTPDQLYAKSAVLVEASTGKVIFEKDAEMQMFPASTTKIMTVYLASLYGNMDDTVYLTDECMQGIEVGVDSDMGLEVGESINFRDLLYGTFIRSANEGANLIAQSVTGSIPDFVSLMNQTAMSLGCTGTHFVNPNGLHNENHVTTAIDMAKIACAAMQNDQFRDIAKCYTYSLPKSNLHRARVLTHSSRQFFNPSLEENEYYYENAIGIKTGFTSAAGYCFVGAAERNGVELISVVFYTTANGRWTDTKKLMEYGFSQFISMTPAELYAANPITVQTSNYSMEDEGYGRLQLNCEPTSASRSVKIVATVSQMESMARSLRQTVEIEYSRDFSAPIEAGEPVGTMTYFPDDGSEPVTYTLSASRSVERREDAAPSLEEIEAQVYADPNPFPPLTFEMILYLSAIAGLILLLILLLRRMFRRTGRLGGKRIKMPKPKNRFFR